MDRTVRVLLIDDDEDDFLLMRETLQVGPARFDVDWCESPERGLVEIGEDRHNCYLVDYHLGSVNGLDLIREAVANGCRKPLILLTGAAREDRLDMEALALGIDDYLDKNTLEPSIASRTILFNIQHKQTENELITATMRHQHLAEVSTATLHNIGNVLTSLSVDIDRLGTLFSNTRMRQLASISAMLRARETGDESQEEKLALVPRFLENVTRTLLDIFEKGRKLADGQQGQVDLARDAIFAQQEAAKSRDEIVSLDDVVRQSVKILGGKIMTMRVRLDLKGLAAVRVHGNKSTLIHVVLNLTKNALEALSGIADPVLTIATDRMKGPALSISDNGIGLDRETRNQLFTYGFTTKTEGNGFGLFYCRRVLGQMGASIEVTSDGPGKGTSFRIEFPAF